MKWNKVVGYEDLYEVSDSGIVRSCDKEYTDAIGRCTVKHGRILKPSISVHGYARVTLCKNGRARTLFVHKLVACAFISNPNNYQQVNHKDENKLNNNVENLEWCTAEYNCNYGTRNTRMKNKLRETCKSKPIIAITEDGEKEYYKSAHDAARTLNCLRSGISNALKGRTHTACGRTWEYAEV